MVAGVAANERECPGGLCGEGRATAIETVPDDAHRIASRGEKDVLLVDRKPAELQRVVVGMPEWMEGVRKETELRRVVVGEANKDHHRLTVGRGEDLDEPAVDGVGDEYLRAVEHQPAFVALECGPHPCQIAPCLRLGGAEHR